MLSLGVQPGGPAYKSSLWVQPMGQDWGSSQGVNLEVQPRVLPRSLTQGSILGFQPRGKAWGSSLGSSLEVQPRGQAWG